MRTPSFIRAIPLVSLLALAIQACGGKVIAETSGGSGGGGGSEPNGFNACSGPGQCVLASNSCCGTCGTTTLAGQTAINSAQTSAFFNAVCPEPTPCPACASIPDPNLFALCDDGACRGADVRTEPASACTSDGDCRLRFGTSCCEACNGDGSQLVAVNKSNTLSASQCGPSTACDDCLPIYPQNTAAICNSGHCEVVFADKGG
ncbi:Hypothetical protein A7982_07052 [Minicystis rosea]|nr:Hypothetical protein A7982_07052 [Minicystis rosea]